MSELSNEPLEGKTPWEFACAWYNQVEIARSIAAARKTRDGSAINNAKVPQDVYSNEFAEWLTRQYRLAMTKGIELGSRLAASRLVEKGAVCPCCGAPPTRTGDYTHIKSGKQLHFCDSCEITWPVAAALSAQQEEQQ